MKIGILLVLHVLVSYFAIIYGCGVTTHTEIAHRGAQYYEYLLDNKISIGDLIKKYQPAFQAGNPFPDSFWPKSCKKGIFHQVSEDTHWVPFINTTIMYIQKRYPKPYNQDALRLIVFLLGFTSHQISDITWHSHGIKQGFLSAMGFVNFHGSFDQAHQVGDPGGDIVNQFELNTKYISDVGDWYIPYDDMYNIYALYYGNITVTRDDIIECSSLLFVARLAEQLAISLLYPDYNRKSSFMADKLNSYFLGGVDDMATWNQITWDKVLYMLENGVDKCEYNHNILFLECGKNQTYGPRKTRINHRKQSYDESGNKLFENLNDYKHFMDIERNEKGVIFRAKQEYFDHLEYSKLKIRVESSNNRYQLKTLPNNNKERNQRGHKFYQYFPQASFPSSNTTYYVTNENANLGYSLASGDLNNDGLDDLVMGAPVYSEVNRYQNGAVFVILANSSTGSVPLKNINLERDANIVIKPPVDAIRARFGHSVAVLDLNLDGYNDIVISAPSYDLVNINYEGRVYVYFGNAGHKYDQPQLTITCKDFMYCNAGWTLSTGDVNQDNHDDLLIGSPYASTCGDQCGFVSVLVSFKKSFQHELDVTNLDWFVRGSMSYEWFGHSVNAYLGYIVVGAPQSRICANPNCQQSQNDTQSVGRAYIYTYPLKTPHTILTGDIEFGQLGYSVDLSSQRGVMTVAVSSPAKDTRLDNQISYELNRAGVVSIYQQISPSRFDLTSSLKSDRPYSGFGNKVMFHGPLTGIDEDLYISSNLRSDDLLLLDQVQDGIIYRFKGGSSLPQGNITDECSTGDLTPCPGVKANTIFRVSEKISQFGSNFVIMNTFDKMRYTLAASSIHSSPANYRLSGKTNIFNFNL